MLGHSRGSRQPGRALILVLAEPKLLGGCLPRSPSGLQDLPGGERFPLAWQCQPGLVRGWPLARCPRLASLSASGFLLLSVASGLSPLPPPALLRTAS